MGDKVVRFGLDGHVEGDIKGNVSFWIQKNYIWKAIVLHCGLKLL